MAPQNNPESQPNERPLPGTCHDCGLGYTPRVPHATKCYPCWRAARAGQRPVDERSQRRHRHHENTDGTIRPALVDDDRTFPVARNADGSRPAFQANLARAVTLRLRAAKTADALTQRFLRSRAFDLERAARIARNDGRRNAPTVQAPLVVA